MRHRNYGGKLGRTSAHRQALFRNMVTSLLEYERIETTDTKAKLVRRLAERMITLGKRGDLHARRRALAVIRRRDVTEKVFGDLAERFRTRPGGYTRILKTRTRVGDAAPLAIVELVDRVGPAPAAGKGEKAKKAAAPKAAAKTAPASRGAKPAQAKGRKAAGAASAAKAGAKAAAKRVSTPKASKKPE
jgi:large subunit ribosomal protein L17